MRFDRKTERWVYDSKLEEVLDDQRGRNGQWALTSYAAADGDPQSTIKGGLLFVGALLLTLIARTVG